MAQATSLASPGKPVHHQFLDAVEAAVAAGSITVTECRSSAHQQQHRPGSSHVPSTCSSAPKGDSLCHGCLKQNLESTHTHSADAHLQALACLQSIQYLSPGPSTSTSGHLSCLKEVLQATANIVDALIWQHPERGAGSRQGHTGGTSHSSAHTRRARLGEARKPTSSPLQRPLQLHQQGLAHVAAIMGDPSSLALGTCIALCLHNMQQLGAHCAAVDPCEAITLDVVYKHMHALLATWPLFSSLSQADNQPNTEGIPNMGGQTAGSNDTPVPEEDPLISELACVLGLLTEVGVAASQHPHPRQTHGVSMGPGLPLPSSTAGIITSTCFMVAMCLCCTALKYHKSGHNAMQISLLGVARLWPCLDAADQRVLGVYFWPGTGYPSVVYHLTQIYSNLIRTVQPPYNNDLHPVSLTHYISLALSAILPSVTPEHLQEADRQHLVNLWLNVLITLISGLMCTWRDWHAFHTKMHQMCLQRARKTGILPSALDPGEIERHTLCLTVLGAGTRDKPDLDPALKLCNRLSQPVVDLRLLRVTAHALLVGCRVDERADSESGRLISVLTQAKEFALLGWGVPREYRANRQRCAMHLAASHDPDDGPVMDASATLNAATACALFSGILGVCALAAAEDVGELPPELLQLEGVEAHLYDTDLLEPQDIFDTASLRMVPLMAVQCLDWVEGAAVSLVNYEIARMGASPGLTDIELMVDAVQGLAALATCGARLFDDEDDNRAVDMGFESADEGEDQDDGTADERSGDDQGSRGDSDADGDEEADGDSECDDEGSVDGGPAWPAPQCWDWQRACAGVLAQHLLLDKVARATARGLRALADPAVMGQALRPSCHMDPAPCIILGVLEGWGRVVYDVCEMISWGENELCEHSGHLLAEASTHAIQPSAELIAAASAAIAACVRRGQVKAQAAGSTTDSSRSQDAGAEGGQGGAGEGCEVPSLQLLQLALDRARVWLQLVLPFVSSLAVLPLGEATHPVWSSQVTRRVLGAAAASSPLTLAYISHNAGEDAQRTYLDAILYCCPGGEKTKDDLLAACPVTTTDSRGSTPLPAEQPSEGNAGTGAGASTGGGTTNPAPVDCPAVAPEAAAASHAQSGGQPKQKKQPQAVRPPRWAQVAGEPLPRLLMSLPPKPLSPWLEETVAEKTKSLRERMGLRAVKALMPYASVSALKEVIPLMDLPRDKLRDLGWPPPPGTL